ncbi:MAG: alpha-E domain-containing protein [Oscillospiraceae bacterium]|nr:alpha-E domain-containing protein [Oscillospiraceae bacterium]
MDTVTLSKQNRLFWLGRYAERTHTMLQFMMEQYDLLIDSEGLNYRRFCDRLGIPCPYENTEHFLRTYLFDPNDPYSVRSSVDNMLGNGMVLRATISSETLSYLQLAQNAMKIAESSDAPSIGMQWVLDDIMAFRGSFDDAVEQESARNITKAGGFVERLSIILRLEWHTERVGVEVKKLLNRLYKTGLQVNQEALDVITEYALKETETDRGLLLRSIEGLFIV